MHVDCVLLLADGEWETSGLVTQLAKQASFVIAADGAWDRAIARDIHVDAVVGDFDSSKLDPLRFGKGAPAIHRFPADKDWTDLELALQLALRQEPQEIVVYGAFGGRLDHMLANVSLLEQGLQHGVPIRMVSASETIWLIDADFQMHGVSPGDTVSLIPHTQQVCLSSRGLQYALETECLKRGATRGISNVIRELPAAIYVHSGRVLVILGKRVESGG